VRDQRIDGDLAVHVQSTIFGTSGAASARRRTRALPDATRDELEGPGLGFLAGAGRRQMITDTPQLGWQQLDACRISSTLPTHSKL
jgi:hypothetical protein